MTYLVEDREFDLDVVECRGRGGTERGGEGGEKKKEERMKVSGYDERINNKNAKMGMWDDGRGRGRGGKGQGKGKGKVARIGYSPLPLLSPPT